MDDASQSRVSGRELPLNSRRLTIAQIKRIGAALELPVSASTDEIRMMIEGRLTEDGREPRNVHVYLFEDSSIKLLDESGVFLTVTPPKDKDDETESDSVRGSVEREDNRDQELVEKLQKVEEVVGNLTEEVETLKKQLERQKLRTLDMWKINSAQLQQHDSEMYEKEEEIVLLKRQLEELGYSRGLTHPTPRATADGVLTHTVSTHTMGGPGEHKSRWGKAPPVDPFTGEDPNIMFDEWLPSLERASEWNRWSDQELLLQLAGHLRGKALREWGLISKDEKASYAKAMATLRTRIDPGSKIMAAQDFRHTSQKSDESVADFIRRLEHTFQIAYGRDKMSTETRDTLLYGQLQDGLKHEIMRAPTVSGAGTYQELCLATRNEEKRQLELSKRRQYGQPPKPTQPSFQAPTNLSKVRCHNCGKLGHRQKVRESQYMYIRVIPIVQHPQKWCIHLSRAERHKSATSQYSLFYIPIHQNPSQIQRSAVSGFKTVAVSYDVPG